MEKAIYLSIITASISFTVTETKLFKPVREWAERKKTFGAGILSCNYCFSHWVAFIVVLIYRFKLFESWWLLDYFLTSLAIAWLSAFQWLVMCRLMDKAGK